MCRQDIYLILYLSLDELTSRVWFVRRENLCIYEMNVELINE